MAMKYGRRARRHDPRIPHRDSFPRRADATYPNAINYAEGMPANLGMMMNDQLGDCLVGTALTVAPGLTKAYRALYDGPIFTIKTSTGKRLSATSNHPVLTSRGFLPMRLLQQGDYVLSTNSPEAVASGVGDYFNNAPSSIQDIFESRQRAALPGGIKRQVGTSIDFHGDARNFKSHVDVVDTNRFLQRSHMSEFRNPKCQQGFISIGRHAETFDRLRATNTHDGAIFTPTPSRVRFGRISLPLSNGEPSRAQQTSLAQRAYLCASPSKSRIQPLFSDTELCGELTHRFAGQVALDRIVEVEYGWIREHVYDLSVKRNWYIANGIIAHNCTAAAPAHAQQVWTFVAQAAMVTPTDPEVEALYEATGGYVPGQPSTDNGADIQTVLTYLLKNALAGNTLDALYEINVANAAQLYEGIYECAVVDIGFEVPAYLQSLEAPGSVWDVNPTVDNSIVGGHSVIITGYDTVTGDLDVISWGAAYKMTAAFWKQRVDEAYPLVDSDWIKATGNTPAGLTLDQLTSLMKELTMSPSPAAGALIPVTVAMVPVTTPLPSANAAQASISSVITDSSGVAQPAVILTGTETPEPWSYETSINPGAGTVTETALDINGAAIGAPVVTNFSVTPQATYLAPAGTTVTANTSSIAKAAAHVAAARA
jgi:hypothetical protein